MYIFVYGTLKRSYHNNKLLINSEFIENKIIKGFKLLNAGFPVAVPSPEDSIAGEVYKIPEGDTCTLPSLDRLEGEGRMYNRILIDGDISLYVGHPNFWNGYKLGECPKDNNNVYHWSR